MIGRALLALLLTVVFYVGSLAPAVVLLKHGWTLEPYQPGLPFRPRKDDSTVEPFELLPSLVRVDSKRVSAGDFMAQFGALGIADVDLGEA